MTVVCVASAHGAPGVTTTAVAMAGVWPPDRTPLLVEADPFGGVIAARFGLADTPGLASLAAASRRHAVDTEMVWGHAQQLPGGVAVLVGPSSADHARAVIADAADPLATWACSVGEVDVIVDCGRLTSPATHRDLLHHADAVLVVVRPSLDQLRPAFHAHAALTAAGVNAELVLVGERPYGTAEVESTLGAPVAGVAAWDPGAAAALTGAGGGGRLGRSVLVRSLSGLVAAFTASAAGVGVGR